jgi:hypothetical protein
MNPLKNNTALIKTAGRYLFLLLVPLSMWFFYEYWLFLSDRTGTYYMKAEVADLNGDGFLDVVQHGMRKENKTTAFHVTILWWNQGNGKFTMERMDIGPYAVWSAAAGDLDGDGDTDLAMYSYNKVVTFLNQQNGGSEIFKQNNSIPPPKNVDQFGSITTGDFNGDGSLDGFVAGCCGKAFFPDNGPPSISWVWLNLWDTEGLKYKVLSLDELDGLAIVQAAAGDLNGDGSLDVYLAISNEAGDAADRVLFNDGHGNFRDSGQRLGNLDSFSTALGDVDGDGDLDILVGGRQGTHLWINEGGVFTESSQRFTGKRVRTVLLADLDQDGDIDALVGNWKELVIWWNDGLGNFARSNQRFPFTIRHHAAVADFNNDSLPDIFLHSYPSHYRLLLNSGGGKFQ